MSGRKQHFIPQTVLRAWGRKGKGEKLQVFVYTRDRDVFPAATDGVGAQRNFYSELALQPSDETLDDRITAYETPLANVLAAIRDLKDGEAVGSNEAAEIVTHLVVRNDHFRKATSTAASLLFSRFADDFASETAAKTALGFAGESPSKKFNDVFAELWGEHGNLLESLGFAKDALAGATFGAIRDNFGSFHAQIRGTFVSALKGVAEHVPENAAEAQRRSLEKSLAPPIRVEVLRAFKWRILLSSELLILPDCVALGVDTVGNSLPLMFADKDDLAAIVMPLSPHSMLIGSRQSDWNPDYPNQNFVACSWDFFVASEKNDEFDKLRIKLRARIAPYLDQTIRSAVTDAVAAEK